MSFEKRNQMLKIFKCLANANRLKILEAIENAGNSLSVNEIVKLTKLGQTAVSAHLKVMRLCKVVSAKQDGQNMYYSIKDSFVSKVIADIN